MRRKSVLVAVLCFIALPAVWALGDAIAFNVRNRSNGRIVSSGIEREYLLYVPESYDRRKPTPLVISMHGGGGWPALQRDISEWNELADREGFIVVYPAGTKRAWGVGPGRKLARDVRFISDLIDRLGREYDIDPARIYANGVSNGGAMSFVLSCTLSDRIAAVGLVGAAHMTPWSWCTDTTAVPMISFHGTEDRLVPYEGGGSWIVERPFPSTPRWAANWARRNRCDATPREIAVAPNVTRREYGRCANDATVALYTIRGGGHTWPGGMPMTEWFVGPTSTEIDATSEMWAFFQAHPKNQR